MPLTLQALTASHSADSAARLPAVCTAPAGAMQRAVDAADADPWRAARPENRQQAIERRDAVAAWLDPLPAFRAGFVALDMALDAVTLGRPITGATFAVVNQLMADVGLKLKELETTAGKQTAGEKAG